MTTETTTENQNETTAGTFLVGVDESPASEHAVMWAADQARLHHRRLTIVHAQPTLSSTQLAALSSAGIPPRQINGEFHKNAERTVARARELAADRMPAVDIDTVLAATDPRSLLLDLSSTAALVVVGSRGHGPVTGLLLGSVSGALVRHSDVPVAVVRPHQGESKGVLIAADGSPESVEPLETAYEEASLRGVPLTVVHCLWDAMFSQVRWTEMADTNEVAQQARVRVAESMAGMREKYPDVEVSIRVMRGAIDACLVDLSQEYELLVVGRPPRSLGERLLLSGITTSVAEHAHCPVLVVP